MSVLDEMTAGIMTIKQQKASSLTSVGMESAPALAPAPPISHVTPQEFPHDGGGIRNQIVHSANVIRNEMAHIEACLAAIEKEVGIPEGGYPKLATAKVDQAVAIEKAATTAADADAKAFQERFAAQQEEAQAQAFTDLDDEEEPDVTPDVTIGWTCPIHGDTTLTTRTSRKGREYLACTSCNEFEKES